MAYHEYGHVCHNYVLLKPKEASFCELVRLLFCSKSSNTSFVECSKEQEKVPREFRRRWLIFVSIVVQKFFIFMRKPLALLGHVLVSCLNFVALNGGLISVLTKFFKGKLVRADKSSSASIVGNLDPRVELDKNIKSDEEKYFGLISMMASKLSYENQDFIKNIVLNNWKMHFLGFYNFWNGYLEKPSTQAFMFQDTIINPKLIVIAFRGTDPFDADAWRTDFDISWYELKNIGKIHGGFIKALGLQPDNTWPSELLDHQKLQGSQQKQEFAYYEIKTLLKAMLQEYKDAKVTVTGHSLGGALAILFVAGLAVHDEAVMLERLEGVYTFGQPRVGDEQFGAYVKKRLQEFDVKYRRYVYCYDVVPRIPYDDKTLLFKHFGPCLYFNSLYQGKVLSEEPDKNYFSLAWLGPKYLNAAWELVRGFIIPWMNGPEYKEGLFMKALRLFGLVIPGLSAHCIHDYVNLTRLGSLPSLTDL